MRAKKARAIRVNVIGDEKAHRAEYQLAKRHYRTFGLLNSQQPSPLVERKRRHTKGLARKATAARHLNVLGPVRVIKKTMPKGYSFALWTDTLGWKVRGPNELGTLPRTMLRLMAIEAVARQGA